jgi:RNA polymerase II subunit A small phosphatase-like protein
MALEHLPMANSSRPSLRERIFATSGRKKQQEPVDGDRERASLTTNRRVPFYRRKVDASAAALSSSTTSASSQSLVKASSSRSFLSKVVTKVVPCVSGPVTPIELHSNGTALKDLSRQEFVSPPPLDLNISPPLAAGFSITPTSTSPPSPVDSDIVVPPPVSATLLPQDETDGMTSGAVQPPGSSGTTDMFHTPTSNISHDSDSDRTSYSEDDHVQDELDEEERLIRNGGSGIPVDLVRPHPTSAMNLYSSCFFTGRSTKTLAPAHSAGAFRSQMPGAGS